MENENSKKEMEHNEQEYPSTNAAYDIAIKSYDWAFQRSDTVDNRISKFLTWATTITAGLIAIYFSNNKYTASFNWQFYAGITIYGAIVIATAITEYITKVDIISPKKLWEHYLSCEENEFKRDIIYYAGVDFEKNIHRTATKGYILSAITIAFLIELIFLTLWFTS